MGVEFTASAGNRDVGMTTDELKAALDMADLYGAKYIKRAEISGWRGRLQALTFTDSTAHIRIKAQLREERPAGDGKVFEHLPEKWENPEKEIDEEFRDQ